MAALAELIRRRKEDLGLSFRQLGERALACGAPVAPNWSHLTNQQLKRFPEAETVRLLAAVLEVDIDEIVDAVLDDIGLSRKRVVQPGGRWIVISADNLSAEDEAVIRQRITEAAADLDNQRQSG